MRLDIFSLSQESLNRVLRQYPLDEVPTVGVFGDERFGIRFHNDTSKKVQVKVSVDGTDVLTGQLADLSTRTRMWVVNSYSAMQLVAWPETTSGGAEFVFTHADMSVAAHTHGDLTAKGYISVAVFVEGYEPPRHEYNPYTYAGGMRGGDATRGGTTRGGDSTRGGYLGGMDEIAKGPAVGAGKYIQQNVGHAQGLREPRFSELLQVRYVWWDELVKKLQAAGVTPQPQHPTGFAGGKLADLGSTPRIGVPQSPQSGYARFA